MLIVSNIKDNFNTLTQKKNKKQTPKITKYLVDIFKDDVQNVIHSFIIDVQKANMK